VPDATGLELLARELRESEPDSVRDTEFFRNRAALHIEPGSVRPVLRFLRAQGFGFLSSVHGLDYYP
jgi:NADH:ubiquinone oxidoreductase subunit C